jgi:hypothetical protein
MTNLLLTERDLVMSAMSVGAWLTVGMLIGAFHYLTLSWNVRILTVDQSMLRALTIQLTRVAVTAVVLTLITRSYGGAPLVTAALGVLTARGPVLRLGARP